MPRVKGAECPRRCETLESKTLSRICLEQEATLAGARNTIDKKGSPCNR